MDLDNVVSFVGQGVFACLGWLDKFDDAFSGGITSLIIGLFVMYTSVRLLLLPFIGQASSDFVDRTVGNKTAQRRADRFYSRRQKAKQNYRQKAKQNYNKKQ